MIVTSSGPFAVRLSNAFPAIRIYRRIIEELCRPGGSIRNGGIADAPAVASVARSTELDEMLWMSVADVEAAYPPE